MPELPEVETVRRMLESCLVGREICSAKAADDPIVFERKRPREIEVFLNGRTVRAVGRRGKAFWLELSEGVLFGHLGMSGWVRDLDAPSEKRLISHGQAPLNDGNGDPKFLKLLLKAQGGPRIAFTDGRRLARMWLGGSVEEDSRIRALGPDALLSPRTGEELHAALGRRKAPIKALLLDQKQFAGVGNWVADEALYHARIAPHRPGSALSLAEWKELADRLLMVLKTAVECGADESRYPESWLMPRRWGGARGAAEIDGHPIQRDEVGGRTSAWVPDLQK